MSHPWFDAHLDLAAFAVNGRDLTRPPETAGGPWQPASVTLPSLREGSVRCVLGTIFLEPDGKEAEGYPAGDVEAAHRKGRAQMEVYLTLRDRAEIGMDLKSYVRMDPGVGEVRGGMGVSEMAPADLSKKLGRDRDKRTLHVGVLIEGADPVRTPDELPWWVERGVVAMGLSWWRHSRYAGGNGEPGRGLTDLGRAMIKAMDAHDVVHDASHLSEKAFWELLKLTDRPVVATHSNCRVIVDPAGTNERHLTDEQIQAIGERGGVVGLNLLSSFLRPGIPFDSEQRASLDDCVRHVERVVELMGRSTGVGLGSDMDGGFSSKGLPEGVDGPGKLRELADALAARGWTQPDLDGFRVNNWGRFFGSYPRRTP